MGSLFGGGSAKSAALKKAAALDRQTNLQTQNVNEQARAMSDQMAAAAANQVATEFARDLLGRPLETVDVQLGVSDLDIATDDLLGRRTSVRDQYRTANRTPSAAPRAPARLTAVRLDDLL